MKHAFITLLNMSISGGFLVLIVLLFRAIFKKIPRSVVLILWAVVALRLLIPFSFGSRLSILPGGSILPENVSDGERYQVSTGYSSIDRLLVSDQDKPVVDVRDPEPGQNVNPIQPGKTDPLGPNQGQEVIDPGSVSADEPYVPASDLDPVPVIEPVNAETAEDPLNVRPGVQPGTEPAPVKEPLFGATKTDRVYRILFLAWLAGVAAMTVYLFVSCIVLYRKTRASKKIGDRVYAADHISTAFLFGIIRPRIYLPSGISEEEARFVILHEETHLKRGDHLKKFLGFIVLILHWFNPLVWAAYFCFSKDLEFSCDERVVRNRSEEERVRYSETMLALSSNEKLVFAHPVAFGEGNLKSRVKRVLRYRKPAASLTILAVVLAMILSACLFTHRTEAPTENLDPSASEEPGTETGAETEEPGPKYVTADIPEMRTLEDLNSALRPIGVYDYSKEDYVKLYKVAGYRLDAYEGSTADAYCFSANRLGDGSKAMLFLSKADGTLLKTVPGVDDDGWTVGSFTLWNGRVLAVQTQKEGTIGDTTWHRRVVILGDHGKAEKVLFSYDDWSGVSRIALELDPIGNKIAFTDIPDALYNDPEKLAEMESNDGRVLEGRVLKLLDLKTGDIEVIHEGDSDVQTNYQVPGSTERYPNGVLYTVIEDLKREWIMDASGKTTGFETIRQTTLYYYQFADRKSYPVLQSRSEYSFGYTTDTPTQTVLGSPIWDRAVGDLDDVLLHGPTSGLFAAVDLERGTEYVLAKKDDEDGLDFGYHDPHSFYRTGEGTYVAESIYEIQEGDMNLGKFSAFRVLNDDPDGQPYLPLRVVEPEALTAFYVDRSMGVAYLYDFRNTEPQLTQAEIEKRKEIVGTMDFSKSGDAFTEEEMAWIRKYMTLVLTRADVSGNGRIADSVKARWKTVKKLPHEQNDAKYFFEDIRLCYDDGETAAVKYDLSYESPTGAFSRNSNLLLLKRIDGQWTTAGHAVEIMPNYGPEVLEIGTAVREAAKKQHGALTESEIEAGKKAAIDFVVNGLHAAEIPGVSESEKEALRAYLHAEYIPEIYDKVLETDPQFTLGGYLLIRPLPYFYVTIYAETESLPENLRKALGSRMGEYEGRYEMPYFVYCDTEFHAMSTASFVYKPIVFKSEEEAFLKARSTIAAAKDGELKYKLVKSAKEETEWKPLDFSKDRSAKDGHTPIKEILAGMKFSVQYYAFSGNNTLWIADQNETWTLKLCEFSATLETEGHTYYYFVGASQTSEESFFMELISRWEAEME